MKRMTGLMTVTMLLLAVSVEVESRAGEIVVQDDLGNSVRLTNPAQRIISLAPHTTELLFAAGAGDKIIGVMEYSDFPAAARSIQRVGDFTTIDLERRRVAGISLSALGSLKNSG